MPLPGAFCAGAGSAVCTFFVHRASYHHEILIAIPGQAGFKALRIFFTQDPANE